MSKIHDIIDSPTKINKGKIMTKQRIQVLGHVVAVIWVVAAVTMSLIDMFVVDLPFRFDRFCEASFLFSALGVLGWNISRLSK